MTCHLRGWLWGVVAVALALTGLALTGLARADGVGAGGPPPRTPQELESDRVVLFNAYPEGADQRELCLQIARDRAGRGDWPGALLFAYRVLDASGDRCRPTQTQLPINQPYLEAVSTPNTEATLREVLGLVMQACVGLHTTPELEPARLDEIAGAWAKAEQASYAVDWSEEWLGADADPTSRRLRAYEDTAGMVVRDSPLPLTAWTTVLAQSTGTPLEGLAHLELAQWLHYRGLYDLAREHYAAALTARKTLPNVEYWVDFDLGELAAQSGRWSEAAGLFEQCRPCADTPLVAEALLRKAEALEFQGRVPEATVANQTVASETSYPASIRQRAAYALQRIAESGDALAGLAEHVEDSPVTYLGQDRMTQGDWRTYGRDFYALCASRGTSDTCGGTCAPLPMQVATAQPGKEVWWSQFDNDPDASMQLDPVDNRRGPHNLNDGGQKFPLAQGPDLVVSLPVPAGTFRLCLYFANDPNYYEPSRRYTVYITDGAGAAVLAGTSVRDTRNGVFYQFRVAGPLDLKIHIWRNLAVNTLLTGIYLDDLSALPQWEALAAGPLSAATIHPEKTPDYSACAAAWKDYRAAWATGGRPAEALALARFADALHDATGDYWAGVALEGTARYLLEAGYGAQAAMLEDRALALIRAQSPRREGEALLRALTSYGGNKSYWDRINVGHYEPVELPRPVNLPYALAKVDQYALLTQAPRSLVAPLDVLALGQRFYKEERMQLAHACFKAVGGPTPALTLPPEAAYGYAMTLGDPRASAEALRQILARGEPLPQPETTLRMFLVNCDTSAHDFDAAEKDADLLLAAPGSDETKYDTLYALAGSLQLAGHAEAAQKWAQVILDKYPDSPVAPMVRKLIAPKPAKP